MPISSIRTFFSEARRRKVYTSGLAYIVIGAGIIQVVEPLTENLNLPEWTPRLVIVLLILGLPVALVLAWIFDVTTEGVKRTPAASEAASAAGRSGRGGSASSRSTVRKQVPIPEIVPRGRKARPSPEVPQGDTDTAPPDPLRVKKAALGHMRHELRTPINGILGYTEMVLEEAADAPFAPDLRRIREAGGRLLSLVDEILSPDALDPDHDSDLAAFGERIRADLRTPINAVIGYSEMVMEAATDEDREDLLPDLERVRSAGRRLLELSEDIVRAAGVAPASGSGSQDPEGLGESSRLIRDPPPPPESKARGGSWWWMTTP
jgi:signal transduction histidine kinase